jgi:hypothetical protein
MPVIAARDLDPTPVRALRIDGASIRVARARAVLP